MRKRTASTFATSIAITGLLGACSPPTPGTASTDTAIAETAETAATTTSDPAEPPPQETGSRPVQPDVFIPADFEPPRLAEAEGFKIVPLGPELVQIDFDAYMSSIEHLQRTFSRSTAWPREGITDEEAMLDMQTEQARFERRESFAFAVLTPDGRRERGCVYVRPSGKPGFDAEVVMWVTKAEFDAGFDDALFTWVQTWISDAWPFQAVAFPGRTTTWETWDQLPSRDSISPELALAERFVDAFYSFDRTRLAPLLANAGSSAAKILWYQGWAEGGNYKVVNRQACIVVSEHVVDCPITVQDDPVLALRTGFNVTDTFTLSFRDSSISAVETRSNDQPVYFKAREWVAANMPEVMTGPCKGSEDGSGTTPGDCARAMTSGYARFAESAEFPGSNAL